MKFSLSWLKDYLDTTASVPEISDTLTRIGLEVEDIVDSSAALQDFIVGEIKTCEKHPNADKLNLLSVWTGKETLQIVCGAPNCRVGLKGVLARPGNIIPQGNEALKAGVVIRGIESMGMLCSEKELNLSDNHEGIIDLVTDLPAGTPVVDVLKPDVMIECNVTPNRSDCLGVKGIARDLAAAGLGTFKSNDVAPIKGTFKSPFSVTITDANCPVFAGRYIKGVKNIQSPDWLKQKLLSVGLRPISALVDITNYFNIGACRPLHVFDADKLTGNITVRSAVDGEKVMALDDKEYTLSAGMTVIADDTGAQSIAGIIGGIPTACSSNTTNVFLESAYFDPMSIARTGRALNVDSDSRSRFERGIDPQATIQGCENATQLILDICGGKASEIVVTGHEPGNKPSIDFDAALVKKRCGIDVSANESFDILKRLGFKVDGTKVAPPSWRNDISIPVDLVEEVVRIDGYDKLPTLTMRAPELVMSVLTPAQKQESYVRRALADAGLNQAITWSFMDSEKAVLFNSKKILLKNPIAADLNEMRPSLVPNLLAAAGRNLDRGQTTVTLFEVGPEFLGIEPTQQRLVACTLRAGTNHPRHWNDKSRSFDCFDAKSDALIALAAADAPVTGLQVFKNAPAWYHPGRSGSLTLGKTVLAYFGEIHPKILAAYGIKGPVVACEVYLNQVPPPKAKGKSQKVLKLSSLMPLSRDFAFVMDAKIEVAKLVSAIASVDKELISSVNVFDVYKGDKLPACKKSIAVEVVIQPSEKTLTDEDIDSLSRRIIACVQKNVGAELRV